MQLTGRDKRALIVGAVIVTALLALLLWPRQGPESNVELVPADQRQAGTPADAPSVTFEPPTNAIQPGAAVTAAPPGAVPDGRRLTGVTATGAIFAYADGSQRLVRRGREVAPGLTLEAVRLREVILSSGAGRFRLSFSGGTMPVVPAPAMSNGSAPQQPLDRNLFR